MNVTGVFIGLVFGGILSLMGYLLVQIIGDCIELLCLYLEDRKWLKKRNRHRNKVGLPKLRHRL